MSEEILNRALLPGNTCFGCGHGNPRGLQIEVTRDGGSPERLAGRFTPPEHASGFPGVTHGGALFTAMDCLATWVVALLGPTDERYWLLGSADVSYRNPAHPGEALELAGWLLEEGAGEDGEPVTVGCEVGNPGGDLVAEGEFTEIPVSPETFERVADVDEVPRAWRDLFERGP